MLSKVAACDRHAEAGCALAERPCATQHATLHPRCMFALHSAVFKRLSQVQSPGGLTECCAHLYQHNLASKQRQHNLSTGLAYNQGCVANMLHYAPLRPHRYKYIYIRTPKAASTSIVNALGECDNVRTRGYNSSSCMALHFYWNSTVLEQDNLQKMWKDYFVFGFVRNPWRRAYSLYKYLHSSGCMDE